MIKKLRLKCLLNRIAKLNNVFELARYLHELKYYDLCILMDYIKVDKDYPYQKILLERLSFIRYNML